MKSKCHLILPNIFGALYDAICKHGDVRLVVIDPALAIVGDVRDEYSATTIRAALGPVQKLAAELDVSVICDHAFPQAAQCRIKQSFRPCHRLTSMGSSGTMCPCGRLLL